MELSQDQKNQIQTWLNDHQPLSFIHKQITDEWRISMTYMDLRFLIDDLNLEVIDEAPTPADDTPQEPVLDNTPQGAVSVSVDKVTRPGALTSGSVTFSDGNSATWQLDQAGRIGLMPAKEGYKPSQEDIQEFQASLQQELSRSGF